MMNAKKIALPIAFLSFGVLQGVAQAGDATVPGSASVHIDGCDAIDIDDLRRGIELERFDRSNSVDVFVTCKPQSTVASIRIFSPGATGERHGTMDFQGVEPIAWTRSLALTIAELERTSTQVVRTDFALATPLALGAPQSHGPSADTGIRDASKAKPSAGPGRWWIEAGTATQNQAWSVASTETNAVHSNYNFTVFELGGGVRPLDWVSIGMAYASSIDSYSDIDHDANTGLPGKTSVPSYDRFRLNVDARALSWRALEVHAIANASAHDIRTTSRSMDNTLYALDWLDPVSGAWSEYSAGLRLKWVLRPWLRASAAYEHVEIGDMDLSFRGTASDVSGERAGLGLDVDLIDGFSLHGNLGFQYARAHGGHIGFGTSMQQASLRLKMDM